MRLVRLAGVAALACATFGIAATSASAGITVGPANTNLVGLATQVTFTEPHFAFTCDSTAVWAIPNNNTALAGDIDIPLLLYFTNCTVNIAGMVIPVTATTLDQTPGDHSLLVGQDHSLGIVLANDMVSMSIPALGCTIEFGAVAIPTTVVGNLGMISGFQVANVQIPHLKDNCGLAGPLKFTATYTIYTNTGTMLAAAHGAVGTLMSVTDLP